MSSVPHALEEAGPRQRSFSRKARSSVGHLGFGKGIAVPKQGAHIRSVMRSLWEFPA